MWRTFDVQAVMESLPFGGAEFVAGGDGRSRVVTRARLAPSPEELRRAGANELIVTTSTTLLAAGEEWEGLVAHLDRAQVAGVAVRLDASSLLPPAMLSAADHLAIPIVTFPDGTALTDVSAAILDALLEAQRRRLDQFLDIHQRFTRIMMSGGGLAEIAATLHELLTCPVALVDAEGRVTVVVPSDAVDELSVKGAIRQPVSTGDHDYGAIIAAPPTGTLNQDQMVALERAAAAVAVRLAQASAVAHAQERFAAISLEELVAGNAAATDVAERAISFGWDLHRPRAVLLASIDPSEDGSFPASALAMIASAARATLGRDAIVWTRTATIGALLAPTTDDPAERRSLAEGLRRELDQRVRNVTVSIGVGRRVEFPNELPRSYVEARRAVDVGRWAKGRHVTEVFDQLGLERLLASTPTDDLGEFVQHAIGRLVAHDRDHHTDLVETLAVWLETRNMAEAARRVHVHYNTLKNRMERIEAIIGPVVTDAARALECEVAIYVDRHHNVPWDQLP